MKISLPQETLDNGTLYAVVYVHKAGTSPLEDSREVHYAAQLTTYITPTHNKEQRDTQKVNYHSGPVTVLFDFQHPKIDLTMSLPKPCLLLLFQRLIPVSHWRPHLSITMMSEDFTFNKAGLPTDMRRYTKV